MASRFPMPQNPNGWFQVGLSRDVSAGEVKSIHYFGKDLVLFRTQEGEAKVFDAVCPHLGAHLGLAAWSTATWSA
ncbi:MAG: Rieske (2Fe-2S) protein [Deltaproteobacteria bacterium]|nr:Rieske (2Fe-2S) protein [Deltaproteobacteria bacterium]